MQYLSVNQLLTSAIAAINRVSGSPEIITIQDFGDIITHVGLHIEPQQQHVPQQPEYGSWGYAEAYQPDGQGWQPDQSSVWEDEEWYLDKNDTGYDDTEIEAEQSVRETADEPESDFDFGIPLVCSSPLMYLTDEEEEEEDSDDEESDGESCEEEDFDEKWTNHSDPYFGGVPAPKRIKLGF